MDICATNIGRQVSLSLILFFGGHIPRSGIAGSFGNSKLSFQRNGQTVFLKLFLRIVKPVTDVER